jgi:hypothetical protein
VDETGVLIMLTFISNECADCPMYTFPLSQGMLYGGHKIILSMDVHYKYTCRREEKTTRQQYTKRSNSVPSSMLLDVKLLHLGCY